MDKNVRYIRVQLLRPPSLILSGFEDKLHDLVQDGREWSLKIIAGDFNARAPEWGSKENNGKDRSLLKGFSQLNIILVKEGNINIFRKGGFGLIASLTFVSPALMNGMFWHVSGDYIHSDHRTIIFVLQKETACPKLRRISRWSTKPLDIKKLVLPHSMWQNVSHSMWRIRS